MSQLNSDINQQLLLLQQALKNRSISVSKRLILKVVSASDFLLLIDDIIGQTLDLIQVINLIKDKLGIVVQKRNPGLKFLDFADELGNPQQVRINTNRILTVQTDNKEFFEDFVFKMVKWRRDEFASRISFVQKSQQSNQDSHNHRPKIDIKGIIAFKKRKHKRGNSNVF